VQGIAVLLADALLHKTTKREKSRAFKPKPARVNRKAQKIEAKKAYYRTQSVNSVMDGGTGIGTITTLSEGNSHVFKILTFLRIG
jgi:hypothetical protein